MSEAALKSSATILIGLVVGLQSAATAGESAPVISTDADGRLRYRADERGNRVPDFSHCGYEGAAKAIPSVPVRVVVTATGQNDGARVQDAIDYVSALPVDAFGFRGAVLLRPGRFDIPGQLKVTSSGVVLRGSGTGRTGTVLVASGRDRRALLRIVGKPRPVGSARAYEIADDYVPVGATTFRPEGVSALRVGDTILVVRPSTESWIRATAMDGFGLGWKPGTRDLRWDRTITAVDSDAVTIDAPLTTAIEARYGGGRVAVYSWPGRIQHVGVEHLRLESEFEDGNPKSEEHAWTGITMENVQNAWVRQVEFVHFAGSAVSLWESTKWITVEDCASLAPVSEIGGGRRRTFFTMGQLTLFLRCWSERGRHDFSVGHGAAGPNAFVSCVATRALGDSGPLESWASGVLYDNVRIDGAGLHLENRWIAEQGAGWSAANCMIWQSTAAEMRCFRPPTAQNWAVGVWAGFIGDAHWESRNVFVKPRSLYLGQLASRRGEQAAAPMGPVLTYPRGSTNPTIDEASEMAAASTSRAPLLLDLIDHASERNPIPIEPGGAPDITGLLGRQREQTPVPRPGAAPPRLSLERGWLTVNGRLKTGSVLEPVWWRGNTRPDEATSFGPAITRFVPGRTGTGYTDDLDEVTDHMVSKGVAVLDHHYGLWYDRRRDDHERVRRRDGDVSAPFYEFPFARSGVGTAWDGLSRYDLTRYNFWYWARLERFAALCDNKGLVLFHQNYFQHHLLEAGAHWADFPWRSANNINDTDFPEPPPYAGDKRIFQAHLFYDVTHPVRRRLHRAYIRKCLESFADASNVIQMTCAEFTGPVAFMRFWIDTIVAWEKETGRDVLIGLSCTKDVQDAILADPLRGPSISVIDIRYWWYQSGGEVYAPEGGKNLSPRQFRRQLRPRESSFEQVLRAVREYRVRFTDKAVTYNASGAHEAWAVLMGGGSLPRLRDLDASLLNAVKWMRPRNDIARGAKSWSLADPATGCLVYSAAPGPISLELSSFSGSFVLRWIDPKTGRLTGGGTLTGGRRVELLRPELEGSDTREVALWLSREES